MYIFCLWISRNAFCKTFIILTQGCLSSTKGMCPSFQTHQIPSEQNCHSRTLEQTLSWRHVAPEFHNGLETCSLLPWRRRVPTCLCSAPSLGHRELKDCVGLFKCVNQDTWQILCICLLYLVLFVLFLYTYKDNLLL